MGPHSLHYLNLGSPVTFGCCSLLFQIPLSHTVLTPFSFSPGCRIHMNDVGIYAVSMSELICQCVYLHRLA
ncbi:hypothetical protein QUC31_003332 [Theobroma cacao]